MPTTTKPRDAQLLADLAAPLAPERSPFYLRASAAGHPDGWYWQPSGATRPQWLGRNVFLAERALLQRLSA